MLSFGRGTQLAGLIGGLLLATVPTTCAAALASRPGEAIDAYWALAQAEPDSPAAITEVIDYNFGSESRRGIFRDIPDLLNPNQVTVSSPTAPDQFILLGGEGLVDTRIRIGDPDITIDGRHRYEIGYQVSVDDEATGGQARFSWNAIGTRWSVPIENAEIHVVAPFELSDVTCSAGAVGAWGGCTAEQLEPGHLRIRVSELDSGEGVTVAGAYGSPLASAPETPVAPPPPTEEPQDTTTILLIPIVALGMAIPGMGWMTRRTRRLGREAIWAGGSADAAFGPLTGEDYPVRYVDVKELADMASIEFVPPKGLSAWQGGALLHEGLRNDHKVAWLLERVAAGHLTVETAKAGDDGALSIHRGPTMADPAEERVLHAMFGPRQSIDLATYDPQFAAGWNTLSKTIKIWLDEAPYWDPGGDARRVRYRTWGTVAWVAGSLVALGSALAAVLWSPWTLIVMAVAALVAALGWAAMVTGGELRIRTPEGSGLWILIESFRRFVERSEARHVEEAAQAGRLREYTAWATALGQADHWSDVVGRADLSPDQTTDALYFAGLGHQLQSSAARAATAPSSSGQGGGSVGGGGGGGGGGSW